MQSQRLEQGTQTIKLNDGWEKHSFCQSWRRFSHHAWWEHIFFHTFVQTWETLVRVKPSICRNLRDAQWKMSIAWDDTCSEDHRWHWDTNDNVCQTASWCQFNRDFASDRTTRKTTTGRVHRLGRHGTNEREDADIVQLNVSECDLNTQVQGSPHGLGL